MKMSFRHRLTWMTVFLVTWNLSFLIFCPYYTDSERQVRIASMIVGSFAIVATFVANEIMGRAYEDHIRRILIIREEMLNGVQRVAPTGSKNVPAERQAESIREHGNHSLDR